MLPRHLLLCCTNLHENHIQNSLVGLVSISSFCHCTSGKHSGLGWGLTNGLVYYQKYCSSHVGIRHAVLLLALSVTSFLKLSIKMNLYTKTQLTNITKVHRINILITSTCLSKNQFKAKMSSLLFISNDDGMLNVWMMNQDCYTIPICEVALFGMLCRFFKVMCDLVLYLIL
jgi:hypothetical protein